ncbi:hypothetical protein HanIR_Chr12g0563461 [Helianthus annuus]|nr:hypothetical protein HanIR_Chr12g0563461 [Helianthus annuus]
MKPLTPQTPLFTWIVGYAAGCVATLPFLYHRYLHKNQATENGSNSAVTITVGPFRRPSEDENLPTIADDLRNGRNAGPNPPR